jgi:DNA polymerase III sliding clamp (beta) subunit (PCNA family)
MSATLARGSFYEALANAAKVARGALPSARFVRLESKAAERVLMLTTFNGQTAIESVLGADVADDMTAYVDAAVLLKLLSAMPDGAIGLAVTDSGLTMTAGDGKFKNDLKTGSDVEIPVIAGSSMTRLATFPGIELRRLGRAVKFASTDESKPGLMAVQVAFNKVGDKTIAVASATDGFAAVQSLAPATCEKDAVGKSITLPAQIMGLVLDIVKPDDLVTLHRSGETRFVVAVANEKTAKNLTLASSESAAVPPSEQIAKMIKSTRDGSDIAIEVDTALLSNALDIVEAYGGSSDPAYFFLSTGDETVRYASNPTENGQCRALLDGTMSGPKASRWFNPGMLRTAAGLMPEKAKLALASKPKTPILFMGDNIRIMIAPLDNAALKEVKFEAAAVELPMEMPAAPAPAKKKKAAVAVAAD